MHKTYNGSNKIKAQCIGKVAKNVIQQRHPRGAIHSNTTTKHLLLLFWSPHMPHKLTSFVSIVIPISSDTA